MGHSRTAESESEVRVPMLWVRPGHMHSALRYISYDSYELFLTDFDFGWLFFETLRLVTVRVCVGLDWDSKPMDSERPEDTRSVHVVLAWYWWMGWRQEYIVGWLLSEYLSSSSSSSILRVDQRDPPQLCGFKVKWGTWRTLGGDWELSRVFQRDLNKNSSHVGLSICKTSTFYREQFVCLYIYTYIHSQVGHSAWRAYF